MLDRVWSRSKLSIRGGGGKDQQPVWLEFTYAGNKPHARIGGDNFYLSADGLLMPARKDHSPPDLRYFKKTQK